MRAKREAEVTVVNFSNTLGNGRKNGRALTKWKRNGARAQTLKSLEKSRGTQT